MGALPSTSFGAQLDSQTPGGGTPTYQAMQGAISYAQSVASGEGKDGSVAIVLVTDGLPEADCNNTSVSQVKALAASVSATIPTYVIGVGDALTNLNDIAVGGGTKSALVVSQTNAAQIQADITKAINQIKASALTCDYKIPAAPSGANVRSRQGQRAAHARRRRRFDALLQPVPAPAARAGSTTTRTLRRASSSATPAATA